MRGQWGSSVETMDRADLSILSPYLMMNALIVVGDRNKHAVIGRLAQMNHVDIEEVLSSAKKAW